MSIHTVSTPTLPNLKSRNTKLLCVNTNATKYVEMMSNFHIDRACMSDAERAIHDTFVLFRTTKNNKTIFSDRSVEWTMRDIRMRLGKYYKNSTNAALTRILMQLEESMKLQGRERRIGSTSHSITFARYIINKSFFSIHNHVINSSFALPSKIEYSLYIPTYLQKEVSHRQYILLPFAYYFQSSTKLQYF